MFIPILIIHEMFIHSGNAFQLIYYSFTDYIYNVWAYTLLKFIRELQLMHFIIGLRHNSKPIK